MSWLDMIKKGVHNVDTVHIGTKTIIGVVCKILFAFQGEKKSANGGESRSGFGSPNVRES